MARKPSSNAQKSKKKKATTVIEPPADLTQGRFLEILVEQFERYFGGPVKVTSNEEIPDTVTGELREIDVSLRINAGSTELLVIIECRNRDGLEDVRWVEQVITKRNDVHANKAMMVTNKPMAKPARTKAKANNIATRTVRESTGAEDLQEWLGTEFEGFTIVGGEGIVDAWDFQLAPEDFERLLPTGCPERLKIADDARVFRAGTDRELLTIQEVWRRERHHLDLIHEICGEKRDRFQLNFVPDAQDERRRYYIRIRGEEALLQMLTFKGESWVERKVSAPTRAFRYQGENDEELALMLTHESRTPGRDPFQISLLHQKGKPVQVTFQPLDR